MSGKKDKVKPTAQEIALADINKKLLERYDAVFAPLEDEWLQESRVSAGEKERLSGHIAGDVAQAASAQEKKLTGMSPAGGDFSAGLRDLAVGKAKAGGKAQAAGTVEAENADTSAVMSGVRLGRGQAIEAQSGMEEMAGRATSKAISSAFLDRASSDATADMVGSGMGVLAYGASKGLTPKTSGMSPNVETLNNNYSLTAQSTVKQPPRYSLMS